MGCTSSVRGPMPTQSVIKVDVGTNMDDDETLTKSIITNNSVKNYADSCVQTDDLNTEIKINQLKLFEENENKYSNEIKQSDEFITTVENLINPRFSENMIEQDEIEWTLIGLNALQFSTNNQLLLGSIGQVTPSMVVHAMKNSSNLKNLPDTIWNLLDRAEKTQDATFLIRAYTAESCLYKTLNESLARQSLGNTLGINFIDQLQSIMTSALAQMDQFISTIQAYQAEKPIQYQNSIELDWTKLYLKMIHQLIMIPNSGVRYNGFTYRGMRMTEQQVMKYRQHGTYVCNKAMTSTSKLRSVAESFIGPDHRPENMIDVIFIYVVESYSALLAIDIHKFSLMEEEEEVLLMPGILFKVGYFNVKSSNFVEIQLRPGYEDLVNGNFMSAFREMISGLEDEFD